MPQIRPYRQQVAPAGVPSGRQATPDAFGAEIGQAVQGLAGSAMGAVQTVQDAQNRQDVSNVHALMASARAEWTVHMQERADAAEVGDDTFASKFSADVTDYFAKARDSAKTGAGQRAFDQLSTQLTAEFTERAGLFQARTIGAKAKLDYGVALDASRNTLVSDPTQYKQVLGQALQAINDPSGQYARMPAADRELLTIQTKQQITQAFMQGLIQNGAPELALRKLMAGEVDAEVDPAAKVGLIREAEVGIRAKDVELERMRLAAERARKLEIQETQEGMVAAMAEGKLTARDILKSNLLPVGDGSKEHFLNVLRTRSKEQAEKPIRTDASVMLRLYEDIANGKVATSGPIDAAYLKQKLSWEDKERLSKTMIEFRSPEGQRLGSIRGAFISGIKPQIDKSNPLMGKLDPTGAQAAYEFSHYVDERVEAYREEGKDPYALFDPSKPDYLGKPETVRLFQRSMSESMKQLSTSMGAAPRELPADQQRTTGETVAAWKARTGQ